MKIDPEVADAIALANSPAAQLDPVKTALSMLTMAIHTLVYTGGEDAAVEVLQGAITRIRAGHFPLPTDPLPEPTHPPASA